MKETWINPWEVQTWFLNGQRHRDGEPASIWPAGTRHWYQHGKLHREDGPAQVYGAIRPAGPGRAPRWWYKGKRVSEEEHRALVAAEQ